LFILGPTCLYSSSCVAHITTVFLSFIETRPVDVEEKRFALTSTRFRAKPKPSRSEFSDLCALCERIIIPGPNGAWVFTHGSAEVVLGSARLACCFCSLLNVALDLTKLIRANPKCRKNTINIRMQTSDAKLVVDLAGQLSTTLKISSIPGRLEIEATLLMQLI
jgi:hypothetical protein